VLEGDTVAKEVERYRIVCKLVKVKAPKKAKPKASKRKRKSTKKR